MAGTLWTLGERDVPQLSITLDKKLYDRAVDAGLPLSAICQQAIARALGDPLTMPEMLDQVSLLVQQIHDEMDARTDLLIHRLEAAGVDVSEVFADIPLGLDRTIQVKGRNARVVSR